MMPGSEIDVEAGVVVVQKTNRTYCIPLAALLALALCGMVILAIFSPVSQRFTTATKADSATDRHSETVIFFGVLSAPKNAERRNYWRANCGEYLRKSGFVDFKFIIGRPSNDSRSPSGHTQGQQASLAEQAISATLAKEYEQHRDIAFVGGREYYRDTTDKLLHLLDYGYYHSEADFIGKVDDDTCPSLDSLSVVKAKRDEYSTPHKMLYAGTRSFVGDEYEIMKGPHGEVSAFFSGAEYLLSRNLVKAIVDDENAYSYLYAIYGTSSEDANVGKWVDHVNEKLGPTVAIERESILDFHYYGKPSA